MTTKKDHKSEAATLMADHRYTQLAGTDQLIAWQCRAPGSSIYSFDILMTGSGIAVIGDIGHLAFEAGMSSGLEHLASEQVERRLLKSLHESCRREIVSEANMLEFCLSHWGDLFRDCLQEWADKSEGRWGALLSVLRSRGMTGGWISDRDLMPKLFPSVGALAELAGVLSEVDREVGLFADSAVHGRVDVKGIESTLLMLADISNPVEADLIIHSAPGGTCEPSEWVLREPSPALLESLHMVSHAARQILAIGDHG